MKESITATSPCRLRNKLADERGAIIVEYVVILCLVCLGSALTVASLGVPLLLMFRAEQAILVLPIP